MNRVISVYLLINKVTGQEKLIRSLDIPSAFTFCLVYFLLYSSRSVGWINWIKMQVALGVVFVDSVFYSSDR